MRVSVIGTVHTPKGRANVNELLAILKRIHPDVIFLEMPSEALEDHLNGTRSNLESEAVNLYRSQHDVALVPVDIPTPDATFFYNVGEFHRALQKRSHDYYRLFGSDNQRLETEGFAYLNSAKYDAFQTQLEDVQRRELARIGDQQLVVTYESYCQALKRRDEVMLANIVGYCRESTCGTAAFLVGAGHRRAFIEAASSNGPTAGPPIEWEFSAFL